MTWVTTLRWLARFGSLASLSFVLLMVVGHSGSADLVPSRTEWTGLMFFPTGVCLGLLLAFRFERAGAILSLCSLAGFYLWHYSVAHSAPDGPWFILLTSPALLSIIVSGLDDSNSQSMKSRDTRSAPAIGSKTAR